MDCSRNTTRTTRKGTRGKAPRPREPQVGASGRARHIAPQLPPGLAGYERNGRGRSARGNSVKRQQPKNQPTPPNVMHPIAPRRRPFRPHSTCLFRLVLARSRCPSVSQASYFLAHLALLVPPEALCSPVTSPKFSKRCPYGAQLAPATGGAPPATFSAAAARPPQQSSRRVPGGDFNPRPAPLFFAAEGLSSTKPPQPFPSRRKSRAIDRPSGMQPREGEVPTRFRCGENLST
jgi:hypothetical protein